MTVSTPRSRVKNQSSPVGLPISPSLALSSF
jgi:hypothetical protein